MKAIEEQELSQAKTQRKFSKSWRLALAECGKTLWTRRSFTGLQVWDNAQNSGPRREGRARRVDLAHLVSLVQPNRPCRILKKAVQQSRSERRGETYASVR